MEDREIEKFAEEFLEMMFDTFINLRPLADKLEQMSRKEKVIFFSAVEKLMKKSDRWKDMKPNLRQSIAESMYQQVAGWKARFEVGGE